MIRKLGHEVDGRITAASAREQFLRDVLSDVAELPQSVRTSSTAACCTKFAEGVGLTLAGIPEARTAVFDDDDGAVTLTAHSKATRRQISFEFQRDGRSIHVVKIDEYMTRTECHAEASDTSVLLEAIHWLGGRS
ncbi:MAG: hypothetical protein C4547_14280 [Phycisphaerales bacterium]|nr:MAG: hypothetical protein C4547_14280 [Phycisphaerales bacterium]